MAAPWIGRIDEVVIAGTTEIWEIDNGSGTPHNFHIHDIRFKVVDIDGSAPPAMMSGWKDTVAVPPGSTVRVAITFGRYTDPHHPYMFHCHILAHEDAGMMGQFVVVDDDEGGHIRTPHETEGG